MSFFPSTKTIVATVLGVALGFACLTSAQAGDDPDTVSFGVGHYDQTWMDPGVIFLRVSSQDKHKQAVDLRSEYRFGKSLASFMEPYAKLKPWMGLEVTSDGGVWGGGGILIDVPLGPFVFTPSFGPGLYSAGAGKHLGSPIEFRTMVEVGYQFENNSRFSLGYSHLSNAGISTTNPGSNIVSLYYHLPAEWLLGK